VQTIRNKSVIMVNLETLEITSNAFVEGASIPSKYTCEGEETNPPLKVGNMPEDTRTLAIIVEDPDAPGRTYDHWLAWNIRPDTGIQEHRIVGMSGKNSAGKTGYHGPCPPSGSHRYYFHVFALDTELDLPVGSDKSSLQKAMQPHILAKGTLMGRYERSK